MEVFAFLGLLVALYMFHITNSNQITDSIENGLKSVKSFKRDSQDYKMLLEHEKLKFLYDKLVLFSTLNLLITGLLLLCASAYKDELNCIPFLLTIIIIYIPSVVITYLTYLYYNGVRELQKIKNVA